MADKIVIDGVVYNECYGCKLFNGEYCTGDKSYELNGKEHKAICNEHLARQFWKIYKQLQHKTVENIEYKHCFREIIKMINNHCNTCKEFEIEKYKPNICMYCNYNRILQLCKDQIESEE